ncbi:MAG: T9SS type A sorting domain-containing protein [Bacteroidota bacterium]|nr:T9SS type A sorting domain-containing protein [Bacteroidota bacterium]
MKSLYVSIFVIVFLNNSAALAQLTCQTALFNNGINQFGLPPVGTIAPTGPDYGCLSLLTRPVWGYITSCDTTNHELYFELDTYVMGTTVDISVIMWGPFHNKSSICSNLTSSNIFYCMDTVPYTGWIQNVNFSFQTDPQEYYVYMVTTNDTFASNELSNTYVSEQVSNPGSFGFHCYECNDEISQLYGRSICMLSFDSLSQKTKLIWEKIPDAGVDGYVIMKGVQGTGITDSIAYVSESIPSEFIDYDSHPYQYGEFYSIYAVDSCGNFYGQGQIENTCFLQTYPSGNNVVNLNWNNFGISQANTYENVQYIHRGSSPQNLQIIDTIPNGIINYTDITAPPGQQYYSIERRKLFPCDPLRLASNNSYMSAFSNPSVATVTGIPVISEDNMISVNPVPVIDRLTVSVNKNLIGNKLTLVDVNGKTLHNGIVKNTSEIIDVSSFASGTYWLCITGKDRIVKKIIIR